MASTWIHLPNMAGDLAVAINIGMRHAHFTVNQMMVDDIRELILCRRRAAERKSRLLRCGGNVFQFAVPPPPDARSVDILRPT